MLIRRINTNDAEKFLKMLKKLDTETKFMMYEPGERKTTIDELKKKIKDIFGSKSILLIAEDSENIVGFISAERGFANRIKHSAYIVIGVLNSHSGRGIGTKLLEQIEKWAIENNIIRLELTVMTHNINGIKLYEKMGFKKEGTKVKSHIIDGEYIDEYYMAKIL